MNDLHKKNFIESIAIRLTTWVGSTSSIVAHTILFAIFFLIGALHVVNWETDLLVLTTVVSLEAIYLSIFIQMTVNRNTQSLLSVETDIDELEEDVGEIREDVEDISEDVEDIQEDIEEISEDVEDIQEDVDEMSEDDKKEEAREAESAAALYNIEKTVKQLLEDIENLKSKS